MTNAQPYIPQQPPFVMVDYLLECSEHSAVTQFSIRPENIFVQNGQLAEPGLIENIAQTAAAQAGFISHKAGLPPPVGFIASIDNLEIFALPAVEKTLTSTVEVTNRVFNVAIISGKVACGGQMLARCEMKIFLQPGE
ncbi:MAG: 3-hydroxyacyl-ACP dehydratase [Lewinellaceae bacterium]|nr:hypothetical protein [Saprospiraceae bacterium]MCB9337033.1 3-hydroxyacyl-ACP dehydratase [Lewinellaceae bacterium]